jgi:hypothetical protein
VSGLLELELERDVDMAGGCVDSGAAGKIDRKTAPVYFSCGTQITPLCFALPVVNIWARKFAFNLI